MITSNQFFNVVRLQTILDLIQWMDPNGSPLATLVQQGTEVTGQI
jgi:hypothetical protein